MRMALMVNLVSKLYIIRFSKNNITGFGDGEILKGLRPENWRVPQEVFQEDGIFPRGKSPLRLEPLDHSNLTELNTRRRLN
ncbi:hypothetical protein evm_003674 [Chilo suppressalis]|nr:hypothetical protein evm_003674 [Chilo suppressalis]